MIRADLHIHTMHSIDSKSTPEQIVARCLEVGINCIAITDHNTMAGAREVQKIAPFPVILGDEIETATGEVIGYFMQEEIPKELPAEETVRRIKEQGGVVAIPHPFDRLRISTLQRRSLDELLPYIDIIEAYNARLLLRRHAEMAERFAKEHGLLLSAGSDSHTLSEIGNAYIEMPDFSDKEGFLAALAQGTAVWHRSPPWVHFQSNWPRLSRRLKMLISR